MLSTTGPAAMPAIYYNIHRAADDVYLFDLFICLNDCLLKKHTADLQLNHGP